MAMFLLSNYLIVREFLFIKGLLVPDESHMAQFIKDMIDDPDAKDGYIFNRWYADTVFMNDPVDWDDMV